MRKPLQMKSSGNAALQVIGSGSGSISYSKTSRRHRLLDRIARRLGYVPAYMLAPRWQRITTPSRRLLAGVPAGAEVHMTAWVAVPPARDFDTWWLDGMEFEAVPAPTPYVHVGGTA